MTITLEQAIANMRGGCFYSLTGAPRVPSDKTDLEYKVEEWTAKYGSPPPEDVMSYWRSL